MEFIRCDLPILSYIRLRPYGALVVPCGGPRGITGAIKTYLRCHRTPPECERTAVGGVERTPLGPAAATSHIDSGAVAASAGLLIMGCAAGSRLQSLHPPHRPAPPASGSGRPG